MSEPIVVSHDAFARTYLIREPVRHARKECSWCGSRGRELVSGEWRLWRYGTESEAGTRTWAKGVFCSISCCRSYN